MRIYFTETISREVELTEAELTEALDAHGCPAAEDGQSVYDRFWAWMPTGKFERELAEIADVMDEDMEWNEIDEG